MDEFRSNLFVRPSFVSGVGRLLDFGNTLNGYKYSGSGEEADNQALADDWMTVFSDLRAAHFKVAPNLESQVDGKEITA